MILFALREGWRNFRNLGVIGLLTLVSLTLTLTLIGLSIRGYLLMEDWRKGLLGRFEIEAFLDEDTDSMAVSDLISQINRIDAVSGIYYVSREEAAEKFKVQFGSEMFDLLEYNPLPASLVIALKQAADPAKTWDAVAIVLREMDGIEDVVYEGNLLNEVYEFYKKAGIALGIIVGVALLVSVIFTALSVEGSIKSREEFIHILSISGGSRAMAKGPFIAMGAYYGLISGLFALGLIELTLWLLYKGWSIGGLLPTFAIPVVFILGAVIGMVGAGWAAGRRIKRV